METHPQKDKLSRLAYKMMNNVKEPLKVESIFISSNLTKKWKYFFLLVNLILLGWLPLVVLGWLRDLRPWDSIRGNDFPWQVSDVSDVLQVFDRWGYAGGATDDWYNSIGIGYSFTWELPQRDEDGFHGFELPPKNIIRVKFCK